MNPDIFHFLDNLKGHSFGLSTHPRKIDTNNGRNNFWNEKNENEKKKTLEQIGLTFGNSEYNYVCDNKDNLTTEAMYERLLKKANAKQSIFKKQFESTLKTHVDKPIVEFSKIKDDTEKMNQRFWSESMIKYCDNKNISIEDFGKTNTYRPSYQRKGFAQKMYVLMADWLALNDLKLYKGGTNEMSTPLWEKAMKKNNEINIIEDGEEKYIDHSGKDLGYLIKKERIIKNKKRLKF